MTKNDLSLDPFHWRNPLISNFTTKAIENGQKWRFLIPTSAKTTAMEGSFGGAASLTIVIDAMTVRNEYSYEPLHSVSQTLSDFTT